MTSPNRDRFLPNTRPAAAAAHPVVRAACIWIAAALWFGGVALVSAKDRHDKRYEEPKPQVLPLPRELPMVLSADTAGLTFYSSPLLHTGGLAAQIRTSITNLLRDNHSGTIVKLRAFVAGAGDSRRVQTAVNEIFTAHRQPLPVLTILQVGGLGDEFAQVALEAVLATPQPLNPKGLAFFPGQTGRTVAEALTKLASSVSAVGLLPDDVASCTCFASQLDGGSTLRADVQSRFPRAATTVVQAQRDPLLQQSMCQAVARLRDNQGEISPQVQANARAVLVHSPKLVFTGLQLSFGSYLDDAREAFQRLQRAASALDGGSSPVEVNSFSLDLTAGSAIRKSTAVPSPTFCDQTVEGLPSMDASAGIEAVLAPGGPSTPF